MRTGPSTAFCAALVLGAVALTACTGASETANSDAGGAVSDGGAGSVSGRHAAAEPATRGTATQVGATRLEAQLVVRGSLSVVVSSVERSAGRAETIAAAAGGRTDSDDRHDQRGTRPGAELTLRVPNATVPDVLDRLAALGHETDRQLSTQDVTTEVADVNSRVASARSAIASLRSLYARASKVGDVIRVETTLAQREASLESLQARQRALAGQVALATITLDLTQRRRAAAPPVARTAHRGGFVGGLERGWHAFATTADGVATGFGAALPFLLVLAVLAGLGLGLRRRLRPRPSAAPADE